MARVVQAEDVDTSLRVDRSVEARRRFSRAGTHREQATLGDTQEEADDEQARLVVNKTLADRYDSPKERQGR